MRLTSVSQLSFEPQGEVFPSPGDWRDQILYQIMIDRFDDGKDHPPYHPAQTPKGRERQTANHFQGGTLAGITRRLDYIRGLGATAIWITPPFKQRRDDPRSYHGYGIQGLRADAGYRSTDRLPEPRA